MQLIRLLLLIKFGILCSAQSLDFTVSLRETPTPTPQRTSNRNSLNISSSLTETLDVEPTPTTTNHELPSDCVTCPEEPKTCPSCPDGHECILTVRTCKQCQKAACVPKSEVDSEDNNIAIPVTLSVVGGIFFIGLLFIGYRCYKVRKTSSSFNEDIKSSKGYEKIGLNSSEQRVSIPLAFDHLNDSSYNLSHHSKDLSKSRLDSVVFQNVQPAALRSKPKVMDLDLAKAKTIRDPFLHRPSSSLGATTHFKINNLELPDLDFDPLGISLSSQPALNQRPNTITDPLDKANKISELKSFQKVPLTTKSPSKASILSPGFRNSDRIASSLSTSLDNAGEIMIYLKTDSISEIKPPSRDPQ